MAKRSRKTNTKSSSIKKKSTSKKTPKKTKKSSSFKKNIFTVLGAFLMISMVSFGYFLGHNDTLHSQASIMQTDKTKSSLLLKERVKKDKVVKKEVLPKVRNQKDITLAYGSKKPKLAIIIDDVSTRSQLNAIQATGIKVTPSIFPPSKLSMSSHTLAAGLKYYMIHLPMESGNFQFNAQYKTLTKLLSREQIEARVKELRKLFPTARYVNNHTGSVFTGDYHAMQTLYEALRKEGFVFVDSRTIGSTKVPRIAREFGDAYVARDIFIDNEHNVPYIHKQLRKAVNMAKKKGYAIAIGHPHKMTMKALLSAANIFKEVELVYIDDIYRK